MVRSSCEGGSLVRVLAAPAAPKRPGEGRAAERTVAALQVLHSLVEEPTEIGGGPEHLVGGTTGLASPRDVAGLLELCRQARLTVDVAESLAAGVWSAAVFDRKGVYRYLLIRRLGDGPAALFVMLNPSTATATEDDQTIRRCMSFARREGCGALVVANLFALRATDPRELRTHPAPVGELTDVLLDAIVARLLAAAPAGPVIAAWGAHGGLGGRDRAVTRALAASGASVQCLGVTRDGCPRHPSRLSNLTQLVPYQLPVLNGKGLN